MAVSRHFCGDTFVSLKLFDEAKSCCGDSDCCHNENHFYQVQDDFSLAQIQVIPQLAETDILGHELFSFALISEIKNSDNHIIFTESPPPPLIQTILSSLQTYRL